MQNNFNRLTTCFVAATLLLTAASGSAQILTSIYSFDNNTNDLNFTAGLLLSSNTLYGTAVGGALPNGGRSAEPVSGGAVFSINTDGTGFTNLHNFSANLASNSDGALPCSGLALSGNTLYGLTAAGGS